PAARSEEGIPVGNGPMGSLVWTTPTALRFPINRVDVYANGCATNSFFKRNNDYCGGCAYLDIDFAGLAGNPFPATGFHQRLSVYDGLLTVEGEQVSARIVAWPAQDVMAIEVDDRRAARPPVSVTLRMLRYSTKYFGKQLEEFARDRIVMVETRNQTAASQLLIRDGRIGLTQEFREGAFYCGSAVAAAIAGGDAAPRFVNETDVAITLEAGPGPFTILIASAASFDPAEDVAAAAFRLLEAAARQRFPVLAKDTQEWWHDFWSRGFVELDSADGTADYIALNYNYFLYLMGASSRGTLPPKFNGMIWNTGGDLRTWGAQHWFANLSCYYEGMPATNRWELMDPMFNMYSGMSDACAVAARQQWGSQGMYIPETVYFDGLEKLPGDIASEMQELYLLRKPWAERSTRFREFSETKHPHSSR
ncbi:MAG: DUF5703 domain-containing protein, partial [Bryobacteraceae bacterium]